MSQEERGDSLEKTKQQIRGLVGEIAQLSKSDLSPEEYYAAFLQRVIQALAAVGLTATGFTRWRLGKP